MNSFFGNIVAPQDGSFDMTIQVIPKGTLLKGLIEESKWETYTPEATNEEPYPVTQTFIKNTWSVLEGEYQNRKVFQKLHVQSEDQGKKERGLQMLAAVDANAGGKVMAAGVMPDDMMLSMSLCNVPMMFMVDVWSIGGNEGNHIVAVSRAQQVQQQQVQQQPMQVMSQGQAINQAVQNVQNAPQQQQPVQQQAQQAPQQQQPQQPVQQLQADDIPF